MSYRGKYWEINDFSGGYAPDVAITNLGLNQASDTSMVVVGPGGAYVRAMRGSAYGNSTELGTGADTWPVTGVGQLMVNGITEYVAAVKKDKFYSSAFSYSRNGLSFTDRTGAFGGFGLEASASAQGLSRRTTFCTLNNILVGFGGYMTSLADTPFKWIGGANNIAALGGSPPAATRCFSTNNRVFAYGINAPLEQAIYWCALSNPEDWTGTGSGSATAGGSQDGERILGHAVLSNNLTLLFKRNSIYRMDTTASPFPITPLFKGIGLIAPDSLVVVNGVVWFISAEKRLCSTDGNSVTDYPNTAVSFFGGGAFTNASNLSIFAYRLTGLDYDWLVFTFFALRSGSPLYLGKTSYQMAWDLKNKCWIAINTIASLASASPSGNTAPVICGETFSDGTFWGGYAAGGFLLQPDYVGLNNAHDTTSTFTSYWTTGWIKSGAQNMIVRPARLAQQYSTTAAGGSISTQYGFDFVNDGSRSITFSVVPTASETITSKSGFITGAGNFFQMKHILNASGNSTTLHSAMIYGKTSGTKVLAA